MTWFRWVAVVLAAAAVLTACTGGSPPGPVVTVPEGQLLGRTGDGVQRFQGIPYAAAPVGDLRWSAPAPTAPWPGLRSAVDPGPRCPQQFPPAGTPAGGPPAADPGTAEDCLTLAVTAPAGTAPGADLPVLVWIHGGGFHSGAGSDYDPARLVVEGGLVVVTLNYRLGPLGFLGLPGLPDGGSFGLLDQQAALRWVQRSIAGFGGDPTRVTIAGESAGGDSVCAQLVSPGAAGLFARAVLQSSGCTTASPLEAIRPGSGPDLDTWKPITRVDAGGQRLAAAVGCVDPDTVLVCLRRQPAEALLGPPVSYWSPGTGTSAVGPRPVQTIATGGAAPVPVLIGTTRNEGVTFVADSYRTEPLDDARFYGLLGQVAGPRVYEAAAAYPLAGRTPTDAWGEVMGDRGYSCPNLTTARLLAARTPTYAYEFAEPDGAALHAGELPYLFTLTGGGTDLTPEQEALGTRMRALWARFAATGDPNGAPGAPAWPRFGADGPLLVLAAPGDAVVPASLFSLAHHCQLWG
jgi:para-nitrobenzyl esterase